MSTKYKPAKINALAGFVYLAEREVSEPTPQCLCFQYLIKALVLYSPNYSPSLLAFLLQCCDKDTHLLEVVQLQVSRSIGFNYV